MKKISYNLDENNKTIAIFDETNSGEHIAEVSEEIFNKIFVEHIPMNLENGELVENKTQMKINKISEELEATKWVIDEVNECHANQEPVPQELLDILNERKVLKEELKGLVE